MSGYFQLLPNEEATTELAGRLARFMRPGDLVVLTGDLGAGKTFFTRELLRAMGLDEDEPVTSPTFTLVNEYMTRLLVCHADLYRLGHEEEVEELGLDARRAEGWLAVVEWGAPFVEVLGGEAIELCFELNPRSCRVSTSSERSRAVSALLVGRERK